MKITPQLLKTLREEINTMLGAVADVHGIKLSVGKASYTDSTFTFKLEGITEGGKSKEAQRYEAHQHLLGLPPLGTVIKLSDCREYIIDGLNTTGTKVLVRSADNGKDYTVKVDAVIRIHVRSTVPQGTPEKYIKALAGARVLMSESDIEPTSAFKGAAHSVGIPFGDEMGAFVEWARKQIAA